MVIKLDRSLNALLSGSSYFLSILKGKPSISGMPLSISFELTNHCNLKCRECATGTGLMTRDRGFLDIGLFKRVISEMEPFLFYVNLYFQGEPMMHPEFHSFLDLPGNIYSVVSTNGNYLDIENSEKLVRSKLRKLIISLDGMTQETYSEYRQNGNINKVIDGIKNISSARKKFHSTLILELQFLVHKNNEHQIKEAELFARENGARIKLKSMQIISDTNAEKWLPDNNKFRRYEQKNGKYIIRSPLSNRCFRLWTNPVVTWNGLVVPCCFDKDTEYAMGDLNKDPFRAIWYNSKYDEFRKRVFTQRKFIGICRNCTSGLSGVRY